MQFTLFYRGPLVANGSPRQKQAIREAFHPQLKVLWDQAPMRSQKTWDLPENIVHSGPVPSIAKEVNGVQFVPLVSSHFETVAELDMTLLRPEPPGRIITQNGDIDNRLKTFFDALGVPNSDQVKAAPPTILDSPVLCLLEDDNLIIRINVKTEQWLESSPLRNEVIVLVHVSTSSTMAVAETVVRVG